MIPTTIYFLCAFLITQLGDDEYTRRQAASRMLTQLAEPALMQLAEAAAHDPDVEIRRRCQSVIRHAALTEFRPERCPFIDSLPSAFFARAGVVQDYLMMAHRTTGYGSWKDGWPDYRLATSYLLHDLILDGVSIGDVRALVENMRAGDRRQIGTLMLSRYHY